MLPAGRITMERPPLNKEARWHRLLNQRRIAFSLVERAQTLLAPGAPFNSELANFFKRQGKFGSSDRRLYRELIFTYIRYKPWLDPLKADREALHLCSLQWFYRCER